MNFEGYLAYERSMKEKFDKLYKKKGWKIIARDDQKGHDCILDINGRILKVEEKARQKIWDDILIETKQDTDTDLDGWYQHCDADLVFYGMFTDKETKVYVISWKKFKNWFEESKDGFRRVVSTKGRGTTINLCVPICLVPNNIMQRLV